MSNSEKKKKNVKFNDNWLKLIDPNGTVVPDWARKCPSNSNYCICSLCKNARFSIDGGCNRMTQHAQTETHKANLKKSSSQLLLTSRSASTTASDVSQLHTQSTVYNTNFNLSSRLSTVDHSPLLEISNLQNSRSVLLYNPKETAIRAELLWCIENIANRNSIASCDGKKELFNVMFPGAVPENFSLSPSKAQYLITEALGPYFKNLLLKDLEFEDALFSLLFDDTSNVKSKKEMQIRIRLWSHSENLVVCPHLQTYFIGSTTGQILFDHLNKSLDTNNLPMKRVLTLGCDGPNVNKTVLRLFQENLKSLNFKPLINRGTCEIHTAHNSFLKLCDCLSLDVSDFIIKIYYFFHKRDVRCETYETIEQDLNVPQHKFLKHISTRWLTLGPAAKRIEEQLPALSYYFLKYLPPKKKIILLKNKIIWTLENI